MRSIGITRVWHGKVKREDANIYVDYVIKTGIRDYKITQGLIKAEILRRIDGDVCHIYVVSQWKSYDDIIAFAGEDYIKAQYYPKDKEFLLELEEEVKHFETLTFNEKIF